MTPPPPCSLPDPPSAPSGRPHPGGAMGDLGRRSTVEDKFTTRYNAFLQTLNSEAKERDQALRQTTANLKAQQRANEVRHSIVLNLILIDKYLCDLKMIYLILILFFVVKPMHVKSIFSKMFSTKYVRN